MFTGSGPSSTAHRSNRAYCGPSPTLAEHLRAQGYQTAGIVANVRMCNTAYGLGRGFDYYLDYPCNQEISLRAMMDNSALGRVVMELCRRMLLPIAGPTPFGLCAPHAGSRPTDAPGWMESPKATRARLSDRAGRFSSS